ncbi:MAG: hypothetical protein ABIH23_01215, partial [bacterium]
PPLIGASFFSEILSMKENQPLRTLYHSHSNRIKHLTVNTDTVLHNINTPDEFRAIQQQFGDKPEQEEI